MGFACTFVTYLQYVVITTLQESQTTERPRKARLSNLRFVCNLTAVT